MNATASASYGSKHEDVPPDYFEVRGDFSKKLVEDLDIYKNPDTIGSSTKRFIEEIYSKKGEESAPV